MFHAFVSSQTYWPPATQCVELLTSISIGAMNRGLGSQTAGGSVAVRHDGEISRSVATAPSVVTNMSRYDVLLDGPVAVLRVDDRVAAVTGERLLDLRHVRPGVRLAVVLQAAPVREAVLADLARRRSSSSAVVCSVALRLVQWPRLCQVSGRRHTPPSLPVQNWPSKIIPACWSGCVVPRAVVRVVVVRVAGDVEVPVRPDREPVRAAVGRLEDLLELQVDVAAVVRVGEDVLVVVGLDARVVRRRRVAECGLRVGQLVGVRDQRPRPGRVARLRHEDALAAQVVGRGVLDDCVQPAAGRR